LARLSVGVGGFVLQARVQMVGRNGVAKPPLRRALAVSTAAVVPVLFTSRLWLLLLRRAAVDVCHNDKHACWRLLKGKKGVMYWE
jgi:hypothetical protein